MYMNKLTCPYLAALPRELLCRSLCARRRAKGVEIDAIDVDIMLDGPREGERGAKLRSLELRMRRLFVRVDSETSLM